MTELVPEECFTLAGYDADGILHLVAPLGLDVASDSPGWMTRCGLGADDGPWRRVVIEDQLVVCASCASQAGFR